MRKNITPHVTLSFFAHLISCEAIWIPHDHLKGCFFISKEKKSVEEWGDRGCVESLVVVHATFNHRVRKLWSQVPTRSRKKTARFSRWYYYFMLVFSVGELTCKTSKPGDRWTLSYSSCGNLGSNITEWLVEMAATICCIEACHLLSIQWKFVWWAIHNSKITSNISFGTMLRTLKNSFSQNKP